MCPRCQRPVKVFGDRSIRNAAAHRRCRHAGCPGQLVRAAGAERASAGHCSRSRTTTACSRWSRTTPAGPDHEERHEPTGVRGAVAQLSTQQAARAKCTISTPPLARDPRRASGLGQIDDPAAAGPRRQDAGRGRPAPVPGTLLRSRPRPAGVTSRPRCTGSSSACDNSPPTCRCEGRHSQRSTTISSSTYYSQGLGGNAYARNAAEMKPTVSGWRARRPRGRSRAPLPAHRLGTRSTRRTGAWRPRRRRGPRGRGPPSRPDPARASAVVWKRGLNPRVYTRFLPHGYEQAWARLLRGETEPRP